MKTTHTVKPAQTPETDSIEFRREGSRQWVVLASDARIFERGRDHIAAERDQLLAVTAGLMATLTQAIEKSGHSVSGPTDSRAAEDGEPVWVCNARAALSLARAAIAKAGKV